MVTVGIVVFAAASAMCGLTPKGGLAEAWIAFRVLQGAGGAFMYPAALAIVVEAFPLRERGQGPRDVLRRGRGADRDRPRPRRLAYRMDLAGDLLGERAGRAVALVLTAMAGPVTGTGPRRSTTGASS